MAMLAEKKRREKWCLNPRGKTWTDDQSKFGQRLLEKMGWKTGQGLGANNQGPTDIVKVRMKDDNKGLGFKENGEEWLKTTSDFNELLDKLGSSMEESGEEQEGVAISLEDRSKKSKSRVHYQKFTRGKDLSRYSEKDLASIIGPEVLKTRIESGSETDYASNQVNKGSSKDYFNSKVKSKSDKQSGNNNRNYENAEHSNSSNDTENKFIYAEFINCPEECNDEYIDSVKRSSDVRRKKNRTNKLNIDSIEHEHAENPRVHNKDPDQSLKTQGSCVKISIKKIIEEECIPADYKNDAASNTTISNKKIKKKKSTAENESSQEQFGQDYSWSVNCRSEFREKNIKKMKQDVDSIQPTHFENPGDCHEDFHHIHEPQGVLHTKKSKKTNAQEESIHVSNENDAVQDTTPKKKKKSRVEKESCREQFDQEYSGSVECVGEIKKKKGRKNKQDPDGLQLAHTENPINFHKEYDHVLEPQNVSCGLKISNKRKKNRVAEMEHDSVDNIADVEVDEGKPSKKKSKRLEENISFDPTEEGSKLSDTIESKTDKNKIHNQLDSFLSDKVVKGVHDHVTDVQRKLKSPRKSNQDKTLPCKENENNEPAFHIEQGDQYEPNLSNSTLNNSTKISALPKVYMDPSEYDLNKSKHVVDYEYRLLLTKLTQLKMVTPLERLLLKNCEHTSQATIRKLKRMYKCKQMRKMLPSKDIHEIDISLKKFAKELQPKIERINALVTMEENIMALAKTMKECSEAPKALTEKGDMVVSGLPSHQIDILKNMSTQLQNLEKMEKNDKSCESESNEEFTGINTRYKPIIKCVKKGKVQEHQNSLQFRVDDKIKMLSEQIQSMLNGKVPNMILQPKCNKPQLNHKKTRNCNRSSFCKSSTNVEMSLQGKIHVRNANKQKQSNISKTIQTMNYSKCDLNDVGDTTKINVHLHDRIKVLEEQIQNLKSQGKEEMHRKNKIIRFVDGRGGIHGSISSGSPRTRLKLNSKLDDVGHTTNINILLHDRIRELEKQMQHCKSQGKEETYYRSKMIRSGDGRGRIHESMSSGSPGSRQIMNLNMGGQPVVQGFTNFVGRGRVGVRGRGGSIMRNRISQNNFDAKKYAEKCKALNKLPEIAFNGVDLTGISGYASKTSEDLVKTSYVSAISLPEAKQNDNFNISNITSNKSVLVNKIINKSVKGQQHTSLKEVKQSSVFVNVIVEKVES